MRTRISITACSLAALVSATSAAAQTDQQALPAETAKEEADSRDIIVTARKQGERLLDAPATISVVNAESIATQNITSANQLSAVVPGLVVQQGTAGASVAIRGISSSAADPSIETSVPTYIDGVYLGRTRDLSMPLYDVDHIEVIKGTQSTLLGKNTSLGAISIVGRRPGDEFGYNLSYTHSFGISGNQVQAGVDVPLGDNFAMRAAGLFNHEGGYIRNTYIGRNERRTKEVSGRVTLDGQIGDTGNLTLIYQHDDRRQKGQYFELLTDPNGVVTERAIALGQTDFEALPNYRTHSGSDAVGPGNVTAPLPFDTQIGNRATMIGSFDVGSLRLTSQTAYVQWKAGRETDGDFTRAYLFALGDSERNKAFSQEIRLTSDNDSPFSYLFGAYYYHSDWTLDRSFSAQAVDDIFPLFGYVDTTVNVKTDAISGFASGKVELGDTLTASAGIRYTHEKKVAAYDRASDGLLALALDSPPIPHTVLPSLKENDVGGDVGIQWKPAAGTMVYASWARGTKSGGFQAEPATLGGAMFTNEVAYTSEIGAKFDLASQGFIALAAFNTSVKGYQLGKVQIVEGIPQTVIGNADVRSRGAELSGSLRIAPGLWFDANAVYTDSQFTKDFPDGTAGTPEQVAFRGMRLQRAPEWTGNAALRYEADLTGDLRMKAKAAVNYTSSYDLQFKLADPLAPQSGERALVDASVTIASERTGIELSLIGTNLTNRRYAYFTTAVPAGGDAYFGSLGRPRVVALQVSIRR